MSFGGKPGRRRQPGNAGANDPYIQRSLFLFGVTKKNKIGFWMGGRLGLTHRQFHEKRRSASFCRFEIDLPTGLPDDVLAHSKAKPHSG